MAFLIVLAIAAGGAVGGQALLRQRGFDVWESTGLGVLLWLGLSGLTVFAVGQFVIVPAWVLAAVSVGLAVFLAKQATQPKLPADKVQRGVLIACAVLLAVALVGVFAPATTLEWDSLAYHLAVPKMWAAAGKVGFIPGMHQSNFPFTVEVVTACFPPEMQEAGAKSVSWFYTIAGACALYGFARRRFPDHAEWAPLAFLAAPVVLWEAGTAYIDVAHGLFAGLAVLYASEWKERGWTGAVLVGALLGFAAGTKYTGLQTMGIVVALLAISAPKRLPQLAVAVGLSLLICGGWYVKTYHNTGNPVFPFFYEKLGGRDWDQWRADVYNNEQKSFGIHADQNKREPLKIGHAILGLSYQPGKYTNPDWEHGNGLPVGAIGGLAVAALLALAFSGPRSNQETFCLAAVGIQLVAWFVLSQQSRYMTSVVVVSAALVPSLLAVKNIGNIVKGTVALQAVYVAYLLYSTQGIGQLQVLTGQISAEDYRARGVAFAKPAKIVNADEQVKKVALYHEVFGFLLDKPYFWANPGHSKIIPYETLNSGVEYADAMQKLGFSHVYFNLGGEDPARRERWLQASGLAPGEPYSEQERTELAKDLNLKWLFLLADAMRNGQLAPVGEPSMRLILRFK